MRLPYIPDDPQMEKKEDQDVVDRVKERRGGKLIALDKALLHAPPVADGWNAFLKAVRTQTTLPVSVRELAICRVAALNHAHYEYEQHSPILRQSGELSNEIIEKIGEASYTGDGLDEKHLAVLQYTEAMTIGCIVRDPIMETLKSFFNDREVVELTATIAAYNTVSRFLVALDVGEMREKYSVDMS